MIEQENKIDEFHRKELLRFLLVKTAAVRRGIKPGELLRVRHCYESVNAEGLRICLHRSDIYSILRIDYVELKVEDGGSLVLFYNRAALERTLAEPRNGRWLARLGYPACGSCDAMLATLRARASGESIPHEVGVFIGYPLKDVAGFMQHIPATPVHRGAWRVYGDAAESLRRMRLYGRAEADASEALERADGIDDFIKMISLKRAS